MGRGAILLSMTLLIEDYALIGNNATAALVGRNGSIDWLCFPRFDSPACFAALLGSPDNGHWSIAPKATHAKVTRRYREGTLVLETEFSTPEGTAVLIDCMDPSWQAPGCDQTGSWHPWPCAQADGTRFAFRLRNRDSLG